MFLYKDLAGLGCDYVEINTGLLPKVVHLLYEWNNIRLQLNIS